MPTRPRLMDQPKFERAEAFYKHLREEYALKYDSIMVHRSIITAWCLFMASRGREPDFATKEDVIAYGNLLKSRQRRSKTITLYMGIIRRFYHWMILEGIIKQHPFPHKLNFKITKSGTPHYVPSYRELIAFRKKIDRTQRLEVAACIELELSSGLRVSEVLQLRVCDINFNGTIFDQELKCDSPYVGASIKVTTSMMTIKRDRPRTVYISKLAADLLKIYLKRFDLNPQAPLFPWSVSTIKDWHTAIGKGIIRSKNFMMDKDGKLVQREEGFVDLERHKKPLSNNKRWQEALKRRQEKAKQQAELRKDDRDQYVEPERRPNLHPHAMRHAFACMQYFRSYAGTRRDIILLRQMMGHASVQTLDGYLDKLFILNTQEQWERIFLGHRMDYTLTRNKYRIK